MDRKKFLIITGIYPPDIGGPATFIPHLCGEIEKKYIIKKIITGTSTHKENINYPIYFSDIRLPFLNKIRIIFEIFKTLNQVDCVFLNGLEIEFLISNFFFKKKYITKFSGDRIWERLRNRQNLKVQFGNFDNFKMTLIDKFLKFLYKSFLNDADKIIVPGLYLKKYIQNTYKIDSDKTIQINNFVKDISLDKKKPIKIYDFIYVGRFVKHKNINEIIDFTNNFNDKNLLLVGNGPLKNELKNFQSDKILIRDSVSVKEVESLLNKSEYLIINSDYEGLSHTILEAWNKKCIVLGKNNHGNTELITLKQNFGIIYDELNSNEFINTFKLLDKNRKLKDEMVKKSFKRLQTLYNKKNLNKYSEIISLL